MKMTGRLSHPGICHWSHTLKQIQSDMFHVQVALSTNLDMCFSCLYRYLKLNSCLMHKYMIDWSLHSSVHPSKLWLWLGL